MAGAFPGAPSNLDLHTTDGGTVYQYKSDHGRWVLYKDAANLHVLKSGDIMSGSLEIASAAAELILNGTSGNSVVRFEEVGAARVLLQYDTDNLLRIRLFQSGDQIIWELTNGETEIMRLNTTRLDISATFLQLPVKTTTGDPSSPANGDTYVNTFDNKIRCYADGVWRDLATW